MENSITMESKESLSHEYKECDDAIHRQKKMNIEKVIGLIESIDCLKPHHKEFLKVIVKKRFDKILMD